MLIYLDTHVIVWLYAGTVDKFTPLAKELINQHELYISPVVRLELQYLFEIQRISDDSAQIVAELAQRIDLRVCEKNFDAIVMQALTVSWTRDPFDRLIVAHAALHQNILLSKDHNIRQNYPFAKWEAEADPLLPPTG